MRTIIEIESAVSELPVKDLDRFCDWFERFQEERWDKKFKNDAQGGKLNSFADEAIADFNAGKCKKI